MRQLSKAEAQVIRCRRLPRSLEAKPQVSLGLVVDHYEILPLFVKSGIIVLRLVTKLTRVHRCCCVGQLGDVLQHFRQLEPSSYFPKGYPLRGQDNSNRFNPVFVANDWKSAVRPHPRMSCKVWLNCSAPPIRAPTDTLPVLPWLRLLLWILKPFRVRLNTCISETNKGNYVADDMELPQNKVRVVL